MISTFSRCLLLVCVIGLTACAHSGSTGTPVEYEAFPHEGEWQFGTFIIPGKHDMSQEDALPYMGTKAKFTPSGVWLRTRKTSCMSPSYTARRYDAEAFASTVEVGGGDTGLARREATPADLNVPGESIVAIEISCQKGQVPRMAREVYWMEDDTLMMRHKGVFFYLQRPEM